MTSLARLVGPQLVWLPECGIGYYPVSEQPYDDDYWERYCEMDATPVGAALTQARIEFVEMVMGTLPRALVDVGIGGGRFVREANAWGTDVNPTALHWLKNNGSLWDGSQTTAMTFWDSLEHIHDPSELLAKCERYAFISMPIYTDSVHILRSKHFRKDEHCWYFTRDGLTTFMKLHGFDLTYFNTVEQDHGREDIGTFAFRRATS